MPEPDLELVVEMVREFYWDGFVAALALGVVAPVLGVLLVLRRMPVLGIATPQLADFGVAIGAFCFGAIELSEASGSGVPLLPPPQDWKLWGAAAMVTLGLSVMGWLSSSGHRNSGLALVLYLIGLAGTNIAYMESPYEELVHQQLHGGGLLSVVESGRNLVFVLCGAAALILIWGRRPLVLVALDRNLAWFQGYRPTFWSVLGLLVFGFVCAGTVPIVGTECVLALLLLPALIIRPAARSMRVWLLGSVCAGVLGVAGAFVIAVLRNWSLGPSIILSVLLASGAVAGSVWVLLRPKRAVL